MGKFTDFCLGPDQLLTEHDNTICDTIAPEVEVYTYGMGREGCIRARECKNLQWGAGVTFAPSTSACTNLERTGTAGVGNDYAVQSCCSTDFLLMVPAGTMSLPFHREGVTRGECCQFMTVLSTDTYC